MGHLLIILSTVWADRFTTAAHQFTSSSSGISHTLRAALHSPASSEEKRSEFFILPSICALSGHAPVAKRDADSPRL